MISDRTIKTTAKATSGTTFCPLPNMIGMGPIRITAPPLTPFELEIELNAISSIPRKIATKANKNKRTANEFAELDTPPAMRVLGSG